MMPLWFDMLLRYFSGSTLLFLFFYR